jgi:hypothetical protein
MDGPSRKDGVAKRDMQRRTLVKWEANRIGSELALAACIFTTEQDGEEEGVTCDSTSTT